VLHKYDIKRGEETNEVQQLPPAFKKFHFFTLFVVNVKERAFEQLSLKRNI